MFFRKLWVILITLFVSACSTVNSNSLPIPNKLASIAAAAQQQAELQGIPHHSKITIIDYSLPSNQKRLWTVDADKKKLLFHDYVTHGAGSGQLYAHSFSNIPESHQSSLGTYITKESYQGKYGLSLRLQGLEKNINDKAMQRAIVIHAASYADESFIESYGYAGRSWGCPAVNPRLAPKLINTIKNGSLLIIYYPDEAWLSRSKFVNQKT